MSLIRQYLTFLAVCILLATVVADKMLFMDQDSWTPIQLLFPALGGYDIVGLSSSFGNTIVEDGLWDAENILTKFNWTDCVPSYAGSSQPLIRTQDTFDAWQSLYGPLVWKGAFNPSYKSYGNATRYNDLPGAMALVNAVRKNPGEVSVYAGGALSTIATALQLYPKLAEEAAGLIVAGGYIDSQYAQATGGNRSYDFNTDFNLIVDPEAAQIVLTASWKSIVLSGSVTSEFFRSQELYDRIIKKAGGYDSLKNNPKLAGALQFVGNGTFNEMLNVPLWDEVTSALIGFPDLITDSIDVKVAVDTSFNSPFYGTLRIWPANLAPRKGVRTGNATIITSIDHDRFYDLILDAFFKDWTHYCTSGAPLDLPNN